VVDDRVLEGRDEVPVQLGQGRRSVGGSGVDAVDQLVGEELRQRTDDTDDVDRNTREQLTTTTSTMLLLMVVVVVVVVMMMMMGMV